ncbi:MAG: calcium-binding protein [Acidimicrobiales bacterium]
MLKARRTTMVAVVATLMMGVLLVGTDAASAAPTRSTDPVGGYVYEDNRAPGGPTFTFRNAPTTILTAGLDDNTANVALPFSFPYYGANQTTMTVSVNGAVVFGNSQPIAFTNNSLGVNNQNMIAPLWDDWVVFGRVGTGVAGAAPNRVFTVHWDDVRPFGGIAADSVDFQMQLFENGRIEFQYLDVESSATHDRGVSATVGIDHGNTSALQYSFNASSLVDNRAIRFRPVRCQGHVPTITGTFGPDAIAGTAGVDVIVALSGNDTVSTGAGNDIVCAGDGNDNVNLGADNDRTEGGNGNDTLSGRGGNDRLDGGAHADTLRGGPGLGDVCIGRTGFDNAAGCESVSGVP